MALTEKEKAIADKVALVIVPFYATYKIAKEVVKIWKKRWK